MDLTKLDKQTLLMKRQVLQRRCQTGSRPDTTVEGILARRSIKLTAEELADNQRVMKEIEVLINN